MKTITFYSYKGGVGRSLALSNIAKRLSEFGKKVCIIDFDLDAPGIDLKFENYIDKDKIKKGIVDYIFSYTNEKKIPSSIEDYITKINFNNNNFQSIDLIAAGNTSSSEYWKKLSMIFWGDLFYKKNSEGVRFFIDLKEKIKNELKPDFLLIDSRTGITDIAGITMSIMADEIVLLSANNKENINGIKQVISTISNPENNFSVKIPKLHVVLSRIPFSTKAFEKYKEQNAIKNLLDEINNIKGKKNISKILVLHSDPDLEYEEKFKIGYDDQIIKSNSIPLDLDYLNLFKELTHDVLSDEDKERFLILRKTESLIEKSRETKDNALKIKYLEQALEVNPISDEANFELGSIYLNTLNYDLAVTQMENALKINPNNFLYKGVLAMAMARIDNGDSIKKAKTIFNNILNEQPKNYIILRELGRLYSKQEKFEKAVTYYNKALNINRTSEGLNSLADLYKKMEKYEKALDYVYQALEINPQNPFATGTLAEIQAYLGNDREFYKNLELFFSFQNNNTSFNFQEIINEDKIYQKYLDKRRFLEIIERYNIQLDIV